MNTQALLEKINYFKYKDSEKLLKQESVKNTKLTFWLLYIFLTLSFLTFEPTFALLWQKEAYLNMVGLASLSSVFTLIVAGAISFITPLSDFVEKIRPKFKKLNKQVSTQEAILTEKLTDISTQYEILEHFSHLQEYKELTVNYDYLKSCIIQQKYDSVIYYLPKVMLDESIYEECKLIKARKIEFMKKESEYTKKMNNRTQNNQEIEQELEMNAGFNKYL